jgi:hypothetical protein
MLIPKRSLYTNTYVIIWTGKKNICRHLRRKNLKTTSPLDYATSHTNVSEKLPHKHGDVASFQICTFKAKNFKDDW